MYKLSERKKHVYYIIAFVFGITIGHYLTTSSHIVVHNILQRMYYVPIILAAYQYGKQAAIYVSLLCGLLYAPHIFVTWQSHKAYQVNQIFEVGLFIILGYGIGLLFEQKENNQRILQSYEKMAQFGSLSRTIIRSLKKPIKTMNGMLISLGAIAKNDPAIQSVSQIIQEEINTIEEVRYNLISLVERKRLRLKKQNLNDLIRNFLTEIEEILIGKQIKLIRLIPDINLSAYIDKKTLTDTLHNLIDNITINYESVSELTVYTGESNSYQWIGATTTDKKLLDSYFLSSLSCLEPIYNNDYNMINVYNTMNNHFGNVKFRWYKRQLVEFILVFPKKLKLPWYLKDETPENNPGRNGKIIKIGN